MAVNESVYSFSVGNLIFIFIFYYNFYFIESLTSG